MQCDVCSVQYSVCRVKCVVFSVQCEVHSVCVVNRHRVEGEENQGIP